MSIPREIKAPGGKMRSKNPLSLKVISRSSPTGPRSICMSLNRVPEPRPSRIDPMISSTQRNPIPTMKPSTAELSMGLLEVNSSARPSREKLVTIKATKSPIL